MRILKFKTLNGANIYHRRPVMIMTIDLEENAEVSSGTLPGFKDRLVSWLPELKEHRCSPGYPGGFIERLERGTYFAHMIEHIALSLSTAAGIEVGFGKSIYAGKPGVYDVIVRFRSEAGMKLLLETAVELIDACAKELPFNIDERLSAVKEIVTDEKFGPSTQAIVDAAEKRNIPWRRLNDQSLIALGYGSGRKLVQATITGDSRHIGVEIAQDKNLSKTLFENAGLPVPSGTVVTTEDDAVEYFHRVRGKVTVKPIDGNHG
ncbi:MAG: cyanophycin synthetase, partial [Proteobacteria bacterium]